MSWLKPFAKEEHNDQVLSGTFDVGAHGREGFAVIFSSLA
jgi:hypothetical protein